MFGRNKLKLYRCANECIAQISARAFTCIFHCKIGIDTAENETCTVCLLAVHVSPRFQFDTMMDMCELFMEKHMKHEPFVKSQTEAFADMDKNKDGVVSVEEFGSVMRYDGTYFQFIVRNYEFSSLQN